MIKENHQLMIITLIQILNNQLKVTEILILHIQITMLYSLIYKLLIKKLEEYILNFSKILLQKQQKILNNFVQAVFN